MNVSTTRVGRRWTLVLALALPLAAFAVQGDVGLNLWDEGFLWYGAQRVVAGEVPLRDFQAYDPWRYGWSAAWMLASGSDGIVALRLGNAVLAGLTGALAAHLLRGGAAQPTLFVVLAIVGFALFPLVRPEGASDCLAALLLVAGLASALERPERWRRWLACGACLGVAATIGINHALYGLAGLALAALHLQRVGPQGALVPAAAPLLLGAAIGYAPVLALHVFAAGFTASFVDSIRILFEIGTTNNELPLLPSEQLLAALLLASAVGALFAVLKLAWQPLTASPTFAAAVLIGIPYAHYALSRADLEHLAVSVLPFLVAACTGPSRLWPALRTAMLAAFVLLAAALVLPRQPARWVLAGWPLVSATVAGDALRLKPWEAAEVALLEALASLHAADGGAFYAAPYWPGAYAVLQRRSPAWEIYAIFPASEARQQREIERLRAADIRFAVVSDARIDGRADLGFSRTHPRVAAHLDRCFDETSLPVAADALRGVRAHVRREGGCPPAR